MNKDYTVLVNDLRALGLTEGDSLLIHSSYKSMGGLIGGIETLISAIREVIGETGTLLAPTLTYSFVTPDFPVFDYVNTPSCVGAVSEYIRNMPGAVRSIHPTHSCTAIGYKQTWFTSGHENDRTPVGINSPFYKLREDGGKILMLGCSAHHNTSMHGVEEYFGTPYVLTTPPVKHEIILSERKYTAEYRRHSIRQNGFMQRYGRVIDMLDGKALKCGTVHGADSFLISAPDMWDTALRALSRDPYAFVEKTDG